MRQSDIPLVTLVSTLRQAVCGLGLGVVLAATLSGCALPISHSTPGLILPSHWQQPGSATSSATVNVDWWKTFGSPELSRLVNAGNQGSFDVAAAMARVRQADAQARIAGAALLPEVEFDALGERYKEVGYSAANSYSGYLSASYELDIWGANRAVRKSALANLSATMYAHDGVLLTVDADVANMYLQTLALREREAIAHQDLAVAKRILVFVQSQYEAGAASALDVAQQKTLVATLRQTIIQIGQQARGSLIALAILVGRTPQDFYIGGNGLGAVTVPAINAGLPSELLTRRPDLAQAERQLAASDANVTVARAAMLPSFTLTTYAGVGSTRLSQILDHPIYDLAAGVAAPIFNAGLLAANRDLSLAQREELLAEYRHAIISAIGDVQAALNAADSLARQQQAQDDVLNQARLSMDLAQSRYRAGAETLLTLLDAQRTFYSAKDTAVQLKLARLQASVSLYKALGGGWHVPALPLEHGDKP